MSKLPTPVLHFSPPIRGIAGGATFNTFRFSKALVGVKKNTRILLVDKCQVFAVARIQGVLYGRLGEMLDKHAHLNHNQMVLNDPAGAPARLRDSLLSRFGPRIVHDNRNVAVIYLDCTKAMNGYL